MTVQIEPLLGALVGKSSRRADLILDLLEAARSRQHPGRCVRCYFDLLVDEKSISRPELHALRQWMDGNIEVVARDQQDDLLERLPLQLSGDDLEDYCQAKMREVIHDRAYASDRIGLTFEFKAATAA